uniref:Exonuclease domain-containing protein n=1 Tax=Nelumbo nucifera TaxID=4432 RepID=A0A822ZPR9_NELNU|nr:TPA_asm: hypothetical protein HUJ06_002018 [Nelumbo nucifera]
MSTVIDKLCKIMKNSLLNAFSVLALDVEDDKEETDLASAVKGGESASRIDKGKNTRTSSGDVQQVKNSNWDQQGPGASEEYKMPLVWIDLEMTGLDVKVDRILEIACVITDGNLIKSVEGPDLVIHQSKECLENMGEWCQHHHAASGLTEKVLQSTLSEREAEMQYKSFMHPLVPKG